jgi:hypothetical protein
MTAYIIWKDPQFYIYLVLFIASAIVLANSIKDYMELRNKDNDQIERDDMDSNTYDNTDSIKVVISQKDDDVTVKKEENDVEKIEFGTTSPLFSSQIETEEDKDEKETSPAVEFLMNINSSLERILSELNSNKEKVSEIEKIMKRIENIEERLNEIFARIGTDNEKIVKQGLKTTPKYIFKYLQDIVDDFDNIEKETIRKRLVLILSEVEKEIEDKD